MVICLWVLGWFVLVNVSTKTSFGGAGYASFCGGGLLLWGSHGADGRRLEHTLVTPHHEPPKGLEEAAIQILQPTQHCLQGHPGKSQKRHAWPVLSNAWAFRSYSHMDDGHGSPRNIFKHIRGRISNNWLCPQPLLREISRTSRRWHCMCSSCHASPFLLPPSAWPNAQKASWIRRTCNLVRAKLLEVTFLLWRVLIAINPDPRYIAAGPSTSDPFIIPVGSPTARTTNQTLSENRWDYYTSWKIVPGEPKK